MSNIDIQIGAPGPDPLVDEAAYHKLVDWEIFGKVVKELRSKRGLSQKELAERCGVRDSYISQIENGIKDNVSIKVIDELAEALGTYSKWIMYLSSTPDKDPRVSTLHWKIIRLIVEDLKLPNLKDAYLKKYKISF